MRSRFSALLILALAMAPLNGCGKKTSTSTTTQTTTAAAAKDGSLLDATPKTPGLQGVVLARRQAAVQAVAARVAASRNRGGFLSRTKIGAIPPGARLALGRAKMRAIRRQRALAQQDTVEDSASAAEESDANQEEMAATDLQQEELKNEAETDNADPAVG